MHFFSAAGDPLGAPVALVGRQGDDPAVPGRGAVITARYGGDALYNASAGSATTGTSSGSGGGSGGGRPGVDRRVAIRRTTLRVDRKRRVKVQVRCGPTRGNTCRGTLQLRAGGSRLIAQRSFSVAAGRYRTVTLKVSRDAYRRLKGNRQRVTIVLLTRGSDGVLRRAVERRIRIVRS